MSTLSEQLAPVFGQIEGLNVVICSQQTELAAIKADRERSEQGTYAYERTNEFICSLFSPEHLPPSVTLAALKPSTQSSVSPVLQRTTSLIRLPQQREYFTFQRMSPELIVEIFAWCLPQDLIILQRVSRYIKAIVDRNGRLCWMRARNNLIQMPAPPFRPGYSCWNACEASFAKFCFNSGHTPCFCCNRSVLNSFPHVMYRIYVCPRRTCQDNLTSLGDQFYLFSDDPQDPLYKMYKAIIPLLSYYMTPEKQKLYLVNHARKTLAWYQCLKDTGNEVMLQGKMEEKIERRRILGKHALSVMRWLVRYDHEITAIDQKNRRFLTSIMVMERLNYKIALSTPTMRRTLRTFNLRLTCLTVTVWREIKDQVLKEYME